MPMLRYSFSLIPNISVYQLIYSLQSQFIICIQITTTTLWACTMLDIYNTSAVSIFHMQYLLWWCCACSLFFQWCCLLSTSFIPSINWATGVSFTHLLTHSNAATRMELKQALMTTGGLHLYFWSWGLCNSHYSLLLTRTYILFSCYIDCNTLHHSDSNCEAL